MILPQAPVPPPLFSIQTQVKTEEPFYVIVERGEVLEQIASEQHTTVQKLFNKNTDIKDPNRIEVGQKLVIPASDEALPDRPMPETISTLPSGNSPQALSPSNPGGSSLNTYFWGQCVWYIKNVVPWVENGWGNASDWKYTSGHTVSATPAVGTVAWAKAYGHVALVTAVSGDSVTVSEMNYEGVGVESSRTAPTSEFEYIYP